MLHLTTYSLCEVPLQNVNHAVLSVFRSQKDHEEKKIQKRREHRVYASMPWGLESRLLSLPTVTNTLQTPSAARYGNKFYIETTGDRVQSQTLYYLSKYYLVIISNQSIYCQPIS